MVRSKLWRFRTKAWSTSYSSERIPVVSLGTAFAVRAACILSAVNAFAGFWVARFSPVIALAFETTKWVAPVTTRTLVTVITKYVLTTVTFAGTRVAELI